MKKRFKGEPQRFTAAEVNRWNQDAAQRRRGEFKQLPDPRFEPVDPSSRVAIVKNTSGSDRDAFDCMAIDGLEWDLETDGTSGVIFELVTADPDKAPAILLEPIENGAWGRAIVDGLALANIATADNVDQRFATPDATGHNLDPADSGSIKLLTAPSTTAETLLPVILNAGSGGGGVFKIGVYTLTANMGATSATADITVDDDTDETGVTVYDRAGTAAHQVTGDQGVAVYNGTRWVIVEPECNFDTPVEEETAP